MTNDLAARLEAATEGSRELSDDVLLACGWTYTPARNIITEPGFRLLAGSDGVFAWWVSPADERRRDGMHPDPTRDLNALVELIEATGFHWYVSRSQKHSPKPFEAYCQPGNKPFDGWQYGDAPALALSVALVRALAKWSPAR